MPSVDGARPSITATCRTEWPASRNSYRSRTPGRPLSIGRLKARLAAIGVIGRTARNTALIDLASQLPPAVLARLLGIDINTAGSWAERAARSGAAYAADLTRRASFGRF